MKILYMPLFSLFAALSAIALGCTPAPQQGASTPPDYESVQNLSKALVHDAAILKEWAQALGTSELARLAAAEMVYRNQTYEFTLETGDSNPGRVYCKYYRQFTGFEVVDIERSDSILHPVSYVIRYDFDLIGTVPVRITPPDSVGLDQARADQHFVRDVSHSLERVYKSEPGGRPLVEQEPFLDRPNYWELRTSDLFGHSWHMRDISQSDVQSDG